MYDLIGSYFLPTNSLLLLSVIWGQFFDQFDTIMGFHVTGETFVTVWLLMIIVAVATTKMQDSDMFYVLITFISGILQVASLYFFVIGTLIPPIEKFVINPSDLNNLPLAVIVVIFPLMHICVSITKPFAFFSSGFYFLLLPTISLTIPLYSFFHLDDFT